MRRYTRAIINKTTQTYFGEELEDAKPVAEDLAEEVKQLVSEATNESFKELLDFVRSEQ